MSLFKMMREDMQAAFERDPAAESLTDIVLFSVGTHAVWSYRWHHWLYERGMRGLALWLSKRTRSKLGVDIHPAATIGHRFTIDHGIGVVIGSTAIIGDDCLIYQGVTLGMTGKRPYGKRHPTLGSGVMVGANAVLLGDISVGDGAKVGAGAVVVGDVPAHVTVVGVPAQIVRTHGSGCFQLVEGTVDHQVSEVSESVRWSCAL
ncbi:MAG: serine O-acetyltransferase [Atopobiaceae bacterium]|nr:serine O-acetyltransferase [Atopobiaceae bacterium]